MRNIRFPVLVVSLGILGCNREADSVTSGPLADPAKTLESCAVVFVNNWGQSPSHGCYSKVTAAESTPQELVCGEQDGESRLRYKSLGHDTYQLHWELAAVGSRTDGQFPRTTVIQKEVAFRGETVVAMEDDRQRVILYPCDQEHPPVVDASTPRSP